ncbi:MULTISPECIES: hypothetical protein [Methylorubrum]|uniref:hypothetical protein n=1 Tax=Methylorubrum TaxID=2282523 RepID=UPI00209EBE9C|nr:MULTISPECIES: hypothetical protein [Methylorubrum]MCP1551679.1 hypothetical protein [Methylorubrum zatmanii]MCP1556638.1 hypothetical protein [Methylorubrum extorquens]MCP1581727.1 hypothetical protein [Methylorubrum extorquens]
MEQVTEHIIQWHGMTVEIRHVAGWGAGYDHLEIRSIKPERAKLPITETGYRSHFIPAGDLEEQGGAVAFVTDWLDHESRSEAWKAASQMSLL